MKPFTANYSMFRPQDGTVFLNIVLVLFGTRSCLCSLLFFFEFIFYVRYYVCYVNLTVVQVTVLILTNVMKQIHAVQMLFAEIYLAIMNATVSKIFTEIFLENASKQSKSIKISDQAISDPWMILNSDHFFIKYMHDKRQDLSMAMHARK